MLYLFTYVCILGAAEFCSRTSSVESVLGWPSVCLWAWSTVVSICTSRSQLAWATASVKGECFRTCLLLFGLRPSCFGYAFRGAPGAPFIVALPLSFDEETNTPLSDTHVSAATAALRRNCALPPGEAQIDAPSNTRCPSGCRVHAATAALRRNCALTTGEAQSELLPSNTRCSSGCRVQRPPCGQREPYW